MVTRRRLTSTTVELARELLELQDMDIALPTLERVLLVSNTSYLQKNFTLFLGFDTLCCAHILVSIVPVCDLALFGAEGNSSTWALFEI